jgi:glycosyltransferase involved in cell wall biosynthesis
MANRGEHAVPEVELEPLCAKLRVLLFQPRLSHYRLAVFERLAERCGSLTVMHGSIGQTNLQAGQGSCRFQRVLVAHRRRGPFRWMPAMWSATDPARYDVVIFIWNSRYVHLLPGVLRARRRGLGVAVWGHGYSKREGWWRRGLRYRIARAAHVTVTYDHRTARALVAAGFDAKRMFVAPNAIDQQAIQAARGSWLQRPAELRAFQREHDLADCPVALFVSRLLPIKQLPFLLEAWRQVLERLPNARLVLVGDGPARAELEATAERLRISRSVSFAGPIYEQMELAPYFLTARVFAYPRRIGLSLHHAFGYGLPAVVLDDPQRHGPEFEALVSGVNGIAVKPETPTAFAADLCRLLADPARAAGLGQAARETVLRDYTAERMTDGFVRAIVRAHELALAECG